MSKLQVYDKTTGKWTDVVGEIVYQGYDRTNRQHSFTGKAIRPTTGTAQEFVLRADGQLVREYCNQHLVVSSLDKQSVYIPLFIHAGLLRWNEADNDD